MCGIAGMLRGDSRPADRASIEAMIALIAHRGPDHTGILVHRAVGLGAARLSIVDRSDAGAQPLGDEHAALTFNGEIYNHRELGRHLEEAGVVFRGHSDTEVLFHALCRWGVADTLPRLRGMFAFAFADLDRQTVSLARDRLGIKPLLWSEHDGALAWASEAKALGAVRPLAPDPIQAVFAVTGRIDRSPSLTAFEGIGQVPPGHWLQAGGGAQPRLTSWWSLADQVDPSLYAELERRRPDELVVELDGLLSSAVGHMAGGDAPMGTFLSGGVDSSLLASISAGRSDPPRLFTADVGGASSEAAAARRTADHLGQQVDIVPFPREAVLDDWAQATWHLEAPLITHVNALPFGRLARTAAEQGVRSVVTGEGADELFFGYGEIAAERYRRVLGAPVHAQRWVAERLPYPYRSALAPRGASQADFLSELVGHFGAARLDAAGADAFGFLARPSAEQHGRVLTWLGEHLLTLLHRNDAMGMAAGVEARFPYLDEDVVRFGVNLPMTAKVATSTRLGNPKHPFLLDKAIIRRVAARRLPADIAGRRKAGFPMYGHQHVRLEPAFWTGGYVADLLGLPERAIARLGTDVDPYLAAKVASVEVFGRLFARDEGITQVTRHLRRHARVLSGR